MTLNVTEIKSQNRIEVTYVRMNLCGNNIIHTTSLKYRVSFSGTLYRDCQGQDCEEQANYQEPNLYSGNKQG